MSNKKMLTVGLAVSVFAALGSTASAAEFVPTASVTASSGNIVDSIPVNEDVALGDGVMMSKEMTFNEMVTQIANDKGISEEEVTQQLLDKIVAPSNARMDATTKLAIAQSATYRNFYKQLSAFADYKPTMNFYCETSGNTGSFHGIVKVLDTSMNRAYNGMYKQFAGTVFVHLENPNKIHFIVNGDFYNNGTTTVSGGAEIGIDGAFTMNFGASYSTNAFGYIYEPGDVIW